MSCPTCTELEDKINADLPHVVRICRDCGSEYRTRGAGPHGIGIRAQKGDRLVFPSNFIKLAANPLKSNWHLTRNGIEFFAELVFGVNIAKKDKHENIIEALEEICESNEKFFKESPLLENIRFSKDENYEAVHECLQNHKKDTSGNSEILPKASFRHKQEPFRYNGLKDTPLADGMAIRGFRRCPEDD